MRWLGGLVLVAACGPRTLMSPSPSTGTVTVTDTDTDTVTDTVTDTDTGTVTGTDTGTVTGTDTGTGTATATGPRTGLVFSLLPAPHRVSSAPLPAIATLAEARALVGRRDQRDPLTTALDLSAQLTHSAPLPARTPAELVAFAQQQSRWISIPAIRPGDLLVFDRAVSAAPASLVAVALGRDARGVVEILYLGAGVVRRGFVDPSRPRTARDRERRVVNTYLRHNADRPPAGTRFLAGELFAGAIAAAAR